MKKIFHPKISRKIAAKNSWRWLYINLFITWLAFCVTITFFLVSTSIKDAESRFIQYSNAYAEHIYDKASSNQVILEGFAALFGAFGNKDAQEVSHYARQVIENHPHISTLEIVQTVPRDDLDQFRQQQRKAGYTNFQIKTFGYDSDRKWHYAKDKAVYYPIVFMEPMRPEAAEMLGLDVGSVDFLRPAILQSITQKRAVSSRPFRLVQGPQAYVIFMPVRPGRLGRAGDRAQAAPMYTVNMVVYADKMAWPDKMPPPENLHLVVHHRDFHAEDVAGQLVHIEQPVQGAIERLLFPQYSFQKEIGPFLNILVEKQVGWDDMNLPLLAMIVLVSLISSSMLLVYIREHHRNSQAEAQSKKQLWFLANHDALTGLPNRNLFMNRMEQAIARAQRQGRNFGILFLDLNGFKQINDTYGHAAGDQLLKLFARKLQTCIRAEDSVGRLGGDEFVVLLEGITDAEVMASVTKKIRDSLSRPVTILEHSFTISTSIGKATYPMHGKTPDELLRFADSKMYAEKHPARVFCQ